MDDESVDSQLALKMDNEPNEVSYTVLNIEQYLGNAGKVNFPDDVLLKMLSTAINVRLFLEGNHYFPTVPFDKFNTLLSEDKIFLFGPSGCGKSRAIYEMIKKNLTIFDKIYIINPRNSLGKESGRIPLKDLVTRFNENDAVVWDNFPDDLMRRDVVNARRVLEVLGSCAAKKVLVALKPKYLEVFREIPTQIPEFFAHGIKYNKDQFKRIVEQYGTTIPQFKEAYTRYIFMNLEKIAGILWNKEPTPLTIFDYYDELRNKEPTTSSTLDGVIEAERLLRSTNYYEHQFELLRNSEERTADTEFLYVLKMCYDLGLDRTENKISQLQQAIFKSTPPSDVYKKLSNWVYIYGQYYSMHDVCRDAVNLYDDVKMKILSYVSDNFNLFLREEEEDPNQINLLGLFIGKNIQFVLKSSTTVFLPDNMYNYMKRNAVFEKAIGQGVGEVFQSLDDDDRKRLLKKVDVELEFGVGMAESLGHRFPSLDYEQRKPLLNKIYDGYLFARFFGQSLGRYVKDLPRDIKDQILDHTLVNPQFADGLGIGLGQVFNSLDEELKKEVNERAEANIGLTRGLGFGLTFDFRSFGQSQRKEVYARTETNFQLDMGLGLGLASQYTALSKDLQDEIIRRCKDHYAFGFGFGLYLGYVSADRCPDEVLGCMEKNGQLAYGLGYGFGIKFPYEPLEFQSSLISKSNESNQLDRGLGYGLGLIIRHLPKTLQSNFFKQGDVKNEFDRGLGCGIGFSWLYQSPEDKDKTYVRCKTNSSFVQGLGFGQGYHFKYLSRDEMDSIFKNASNNSHYDNGLGYGLGWSFPYIGDALRKGVLIRSRTNNLFAYGLASGLGVILAYLPPQTKTDIFQMATEDGWFARGLGFGLGGYALQSYTKELQEEILLRINDDAEFATGLGEGIGFAFKLFQDEFQQKIIDNSIEANPFFTRGLGIGFGKSFKYLSYDFQLDLYKRADENTHFAMGLGEGIGSIFQYLDDDFIRNDILAKAFLKEDGFARGLGTGFGSVFLYFPEEFRNELLFQRCAENRQFGIGLGKGLGFVFGYLPLEFQSSLFKRADENTHFAMGLGEGIGSIIFRYLDNSFQKDVLAKAEKNPSFAKGLGIGIGSFYKYYCESRQDLRNVIFSSISPSTSHIAEGFGTGIGMVYPHLSEKLHVDLLQLAEQNMHFARAFGFSLGHVFYALKSKNRNKSYDDNRLPRNPEFEYGFGAGVGHNFPYIEAKTQEEVLNKAQKAKNFGNGFGTGLARSFRHLDKILEQGILRQASNKEQGEVWYSLGYGLGIALPSMTGQLQKQLLLQIANGHNNNLFTRGFAAGVNQSVKYLSKQSLDQLSRLAEENNNLLRIDNLNNEYEGINANNNNPSPKIDFLYEIFISADQTASRISISDRDGDLQSWISGREEVSFLGEHKKCCVCFIDIIGSTKAASQLDKMQLSRYYSIFLNAIATIIRNFEGRIVKNAGDALIYYFPSTTDSEDKPSNFQDVFECALTMIGAHQAINAKMQEEGLPPVNYRISADYGTVEVAKSQSSQSEDLFGSTMNICAKINGKAAPNAMVIGEEMFKVAKPLADQYTFKPAGEIALGLVNRSEYSVYNVEAKEERNMLNPFKYKKQP